MPRTLLTPTLETWEAFATSGPSGFSRPARIGFRCVSDPSMRSRAVEIEGDKAEAERRVVESADEELRALLAASRPLD